MRAIEILEHWSQMPDAGRCGQADREAWNTLEEERQEVLEAVLQSLGSGEPDSDRAAACLDLLRHVACLGRQETGLRVS
jgi:hypothetical protein